MKITIHDVGHGGCAVVEIPNGKRLMLDCGKNTETGWRPSQFYAGQTIDMLIPMNLDEDHVDDLHNMGSVTLKGFFSNPTVGASQLRALKAWYGKGPGVQAAIDLIERVGTDTGFEALNLGSVMGQVFWNRYSADFSDTNNLSLALFLHHGPRSILFGGDLEVAGWRKLLERPEFRALLPSVSVLVASHHGRENGFCTEMFDRHGLYPDAVIISDCEHRYDSQDTVGLYYRRTRGMIRMRPTAATLLTGGPDRRVFTTRSDGDMTIELDSSGGLTITTSTTLSSSVSQGRGLLSFGIGVLQMREQYRPV